MEKDTRDTLDVLDLLAHALEYPDPLTSEDARAAARRLSEKTPELSAALDGLADYLASAPAGEPEERYTSLFDLSPVCTLHVGYHLFGETYQRGSFLAGLSGELKSAGIETHGELADHLSFVLRLLARLESEEDRETLVDVALLPSLPRMATALGDSTAPWAAVVRRLPALVAPLGSGEPVSLPLPVLESREPQEVALDA